MSRHVSFLFFFLVGLLLSSSSCAAEPAAWSLHGPKPGGAAKPLSIHKFPLPDGVTGGESLAFDRRGEGPYAGVSDGRVLKWDQSSQRWTTFAYHPNYQSNAMCTASPERPAGAESICGRPLGLQFCSRTGNLYIADAYLGLLKVGPAGGAATVLASEAGGAPLNFVNGVDVDQATGDVYFTASSATYTREHNTQIMLNRDSSGRLLRYSVGPSRRGGRGGAVVLRSGLPYPNGVAVSADRTHVVVAHTGPCQAFRYWIRGPKAGQYELFADLPGYADNVRRDAKGGYWFALNQEKVNATTAAEAAAALAASVEHLVGVRLDGKGVQQEVMTAPKGVTLSDIAQKGSSLWLGSVELDYVGLVTSKSKN